MSVTATLTFTRHAEVRAVLADPRFAVPPVPAGDGATGIAWLRSQVARFSTGPVHERRRALAVAELDRMSPATLHRLAAERAAEVLSGAAGRLAELARTVPVTVLAEALGITAPVTDAVALVAQGYHPGTDARSAGDEAVAYLVEVCGGTPDEATAARIGLLVQACDATAGLIGNAAEAMRRLRIRGPVHAILAETLRHDPPLRAMRRVSVSPARIGDTDVAADSLVLLDLATANRDPAVFSDPDRFDPARPEQERHLTLGAGLRPCPGSDHAFAIAAGVLEAASGYGLFE
jgi:cytochrome P450